jgi:oligopeptide transport system substrate-binding protein
MRRMSSRRGHRRTRRVLAALVFASIAAGALAVGRRSRLAPADFVFNNGGEVTTLDPHTASGVPENRVLRAIFEPLVSRDPGNLRAIPGAADWDVMEGGDLYRFSIKEGARWSNGDPLTAADFEWSFRRILTPDTAAPFAYLLDCIEGAAAFRLGESVDWSSVAIRATDARTLDIRMSTRTVLVELISLPAFSPLHRASIERIRAEHPRTWRIEWLRPENLVTNGPFFVAERRINDRIRLRKNPHYWDRDSVAFRTIDVLAVEHWGTALNLYLAGEIHWLDGTLPYELLPQLTKREDYQTRDYLGTYFYRFNVTRPPFDELLVRQALGAAVDREAICEHIAKGGQRAALSFVPRIGRLSHKNPPRIRREQTLDRAHTLMTRAGYYGFDHKPFPPIEIHFNNSELHRDIAEFIAAGWRAAFDIKVTLAPQEKKTYLDAQFNLDYDVSRSSWIADYIDPGTFLEIFTSGNENNRTGWANPEYDTLIAEALATYGRGKRDALFREAEQLLLDERPFIPIFFYSSQNLVSPRLGGFTGNILNEHFAKDWYWRDDTEVQATRAGRLRQGINPVRAPGPKRGLYSVNQRAQRAAEASERATEAAERAAEREGKAEAPAEAKR